jgi:hypothetical protein
MPVELQVIRAGEFVCLDPDEHLDFEASKQALQSLAQACRKRGLDRALLDLRGLPVPAKPLFKPKQLAALIGTFRAAGFGRHQRLAVLYRSDPHGGARKFAFIGRIQGWQVQAFAEFEAALYWLSEEASSPVGGEGNEIPIPIRKRSGQGNKPSVSLSVQKSESIPVRPVRETPPGTLKRTAPLPKAGTPSRSRKRAGKKQIAWRCVQGWGGPDRPLILAAWNTLEARDSPGS